MSKKILIIGAGLSGALMAVYLARQGYRVDVLEARPDMRCTEISAGRSINLAISLRGLRALADVDLLDDAEKLMTPMYGRMMHDVAGNLTYQAYGRDRSEHQNSISRGELNCLLMDAAERYPEVSLYFNQRVAAIDFEQGQLRTQTQVYDFDCVLGADGAASVVRKQLEQQQLLSATKQALGHSYKELCIPASHGPYIERNYLHIWPRGDYMLIALPNLDGSFTCTLFLANQADVGKPSFASLDSGAQVQAFVQEQFADAYALMPTLLQDFAGNPTSGLATLKCSPWFYQDKALVLGDAAHAIVPFLGQGMNCAFEDCRVFNECLALHGDDWHALFADFSTKRKANADAIADMAVANYFEMRDHVADSEFLFHKQIESELMQRYPEQYLSKYHLIAFTHAPYAYAQACGQLQQDLLKTLAKDKQTLSEIDWDKQQATMQSYLQACEKLKQDYI